jgi:putative heme-binding domain-containing protein
LTSARSDTILLPSIVGDQLELSPSKGCFLAGFPMPRLVLAGLSLCLLTCGLSRVATADEPRTQLPEFAASVVRGAEAEPVVAAAALNWDAGPNPQWIWAPTGDGPCVLRTTLPAGVKKAWLKASCDNVMKVFLNGKQVVAGSEWQQPAEVNLQPVLVEGENVLEVEASNQEGICGFVAKVILELGDGSTHYLVTDTNWQSGAKRGGTEWAGVRSVAKLGDAPWGNIFSQPAAIAGGTPRDTFELLPGFRVEKLYDVPKDELGSWVCITVDPKGRIIASDQGDKGLCRITPAPRATGDAASDQPSKVERLDLKISSAQGLLFALGHLYISVNGGPGSGLYRAPYDEATDTFGELVKLRDFQGGGEHGPHALRLGPDGKSIYVIAGNHTRTPFEPMRSGEPQSLGGSRTDILTTTNPSGMTSRIPTNWDEDQLLPREWDPRGHAVGILAPGGWIAKTDAEGKTWDIVSIGYRNPYDMAFNADGELFAYDADMEWDMGTPWYRPTRVMHATSGSEFGWRSATGKWPPWYVDCLPPVVNIGPGSPVGVEFGYGTQFPAKYQKALYLCDWTFGTMYAIHLTPQGASYVGEKEEFLSRTPLPLTDAVVGHDGALYFTVGGRGTDSALFRVTYAGEESTAPVNGHDEQFATDRALRRQLEAFHTGIPLATILKEWRADGEAVLKGLSSPDRFIRYAARLACEQTALATPQVFTEAKFEDKFESSDHLILTAVMVARLGVSVLDHPIRQKLATVDFGKLDERQQLDYLRALSLLFIRLGPPDEALRQAFIQQLDAHYPAESAPLNRELVQVLVYLESPTVIAKAVELLGQPSAESQQAVIDPLLARNQGYGGTIADMIRNQPDLERLAAAFAVRNAKVGWTVDLRKQYYEFLAGAREWKGGASFQGFIDYMDKDQWELMPEAERVVVEGAGLRKPYQLPELPKPQGPGHEWTIAEAITKVEQGLHDRDFKNGERTFAAARCIVCHRFNGDGGATGPDLTQLAGRFNLKDLTDAILDPSKVVSDQYKATIVVTTGGQTYTGRVLSADDAGFTMLTDPEDSTKIVRIENGDVDQMQPSAVSLMPKDLLKTLNENEMLDLMAYLLSRGNPNDPMFKK